jgi:hypothetical protein
MAKARSGAESPPATQPDTATLLNRLDTITEMLRRHLGALRVVPYDPRQYLETGPRIVAEDARRVAVVVPIDKERLREWQPFFSALLSQ